MKTTLRQMVPLALLAAGLSVGLAQAQDATEPAEPLTETTLFMTFIPNIQFSTIYVGLEKGYFEDAGYNITLEYGDEPVGIDLIAAGEREFGVVSGEQVILARANDRPVVFVYEWFQDYAVGIMSSTDSGITTVEDLRGRHVGIPGRFGASYSGLLALLAANGMTESDINLEEIGFNAPEVFCIGAIEASVVYLNNEPLQVRSRAQQNDCGTVTDVNVIPVSGSADLVSNGLVTSEVMIAEQPENVAAMVAAFDHSLRDVLNNPAEAYLLSSAHIDNLPLGNELRAALETLASEQAEFLAENPDVETAVLVEQRAAALATLREQFSDEELLQFEVLLATLPLLEGDTPGYTDPASWETTAETLRGGGFLDADLDLTAAYSNEFLPE